MPPLLELLHDLTEPQAHPPGNIFCLQHCLAIFIQNDDVYCFMLSDFGVPPPPDQEQYWRGREQIHRELLLVVGLRQRTPAHPPQPTLGRLLETLGETVVNEDFVNSKIFLYYFFEDTTQETQASHIIVVWCTEYSNGPIMCQDTSAVNHFWLVIISTPRS